MNFGQFVYVLGYFFHGILYEEGIVVVVVVGVGRYSGVGEGGVVVLVVVGMGKGC